MHPNSVLLGALKSIDFTDLTDPNIQKSHLRTTQQWSFLVPAEIFLQNKPGNYLCFCIHIAQITLK